MLLLVPLGLLAFTIGHPNPFPAPVLPPSFDGAAATSLASELARDYPDRAPGSPGATGAATWVEDKLALYGLASTEDVWDETIPGLGRVRLRNLITVVKGSSPDAILFVAHRDNTGVGPGANDNASGTAALIELARGYGRLGTAAARRNPQHTLIFLSSDGGMYGGYGAERFASASPLRSRIRAAVSLDALAGSGLPRLEIAGFEPGTPAPALVRTADVRIAAQLGRLAERPGWLAQLVALGIPFGYGEQAPFLGRGISALRLTTVGDARKDTTTDTTDRLDVARFTQLGKASEAVLTSLDGGIELAGGTAGYVYLGSRIIRGWTVELTLLVALIPFLLAVVDLLARVRRRRLPLAPAARALRRRLGIWLWIGLVIGFGALTGIFPRTSGIPPSPANPATTTWPVVGLAALGTLAAVGWWRGRRRLVPATTASDEEALAGYAVALAGLGAVALTTAWINPYALIFVAPSLYAWLWLPLVAARPAWARDVLYGLGLAGPVLAAVAIGAQLGLGLGTPLYLVTLATLGFIGWPTVLVLIAWAAVASQLGALAAGRYRPLESQGGGIGSPAGRAPERAERREQG